RPAPLFRCRRRERQQRGPGVLLHSSLFGRQNKSRQKGPLRQRKFRQQEHLLGFRRSRREFLTGRRTKGRAFPSGHPGKSPSKTGNRPSTTQTRRRYSRFVLWAGSRL